MASFISDGLELAYDDVNPPGAERTVVLVHGFTSNRNEGWKRTGWYSALERRRWRMVAMDLRGHGESAKPYEAEAYAREALAGDVQNLVDHLDLGRVDLFGYSMGARVALAAAAGLGGRVSNLILGGVGARMLEDREGPQGWERPMAKALLEPDPSAITDEMLRSFRHFADEQGEDLRALAACAAAPVSPPGPEASGGLSMPVLVVCGARDGLAGDPEPLAQRFALGTAMSLPGCDHFSAIPHAATKAAVFDFLDGLLEDPFPPRY